MLNLLIISNNPKAHLILNFIQPLIKAKVDLVADFDHGLKDVFEKRPATVIIQEQIAGVAGESVARHIQLLLGNGAPTFIMMHEGNTRIRPVKGLFDVIVDLEQPDQALVEELLSALKRVIGDEWDKVAVPPPKVAPVRVMSSSVPDEERVAADKLVEDFFFDLGSSEKPSPDQGAGKNNNGADLQLVSTSDELASLLIQSSQNPQQLKTLDAAPEPAVQPKKQAGGKRPSKGQPPKAKERAVPTTAVSCEPVVELTAAEKAVEKDSFDFPSLDAVTPPVPDTPPRSVASPAAPKPTAATTLRSVAETAAPPPSPADFRISASPVAYKAQLPEDILLAFDENFRSRSRLRVLLAIVLVVAGAVAGGWYLYDTKTHSLQFWRTAKTAAPTAAQGSITPVAVNQPELAQTIQPAVTSASRRAASAPAPLPSFVPVKGRDNGFSARKPGWERYVDATREIRIYRAAGRIRAIQVVAAKGQVIADSFMQTALHELTGRIEYTLRSHEQKQGILIQRCSVAGGSDLLVYRKQPSGTISAFVVSLE